METCYVCAASTRPHSEYVRCVSCGTVRTRFNYDPNLYKSRYAQNYVNYARTQINVPLNLFRLGLASRWLTIDDTLLDFGCCIGEFLRFAEKYFKCAGFEPNKEAVTIARGRIDSLVSTRLEDLQKYNMITMFDVIEHIEDPRELLTYLANTFMVDKGFLVITTPNVEVIPPYSEDQMSTWKHYKPREHLFLYEEQGLIKLLESVGFSTIYFGREESDIRPGNPNGDILTCIARKI